MKNRLMQIVIVNTALISTLLSCSYMKDTHNPNPSAFGIYLSDNGNLILSDLDIEAYLRVEHKLVLNKQGIARWNSLIKHRGKFNNSRGSFNAGGLDKKDFCIKLGDDIMYAGKFFSRISLRPYNGIFILDGAMECDSLHNWLSIENGYTDSPSYDLRENGRIFDFFGSQGKLK